MDKRHDIAILVGKNIKKARRIKKISQEQLAYKADLSRNYIGSIERGEKNITVNNLVWIAKALGIEPGELVPNLKDIN